MKVLSIRQPWAWLIMNGYKSIETRSWPPQSDLIGEVIGIHAGLKIENWMNWLIISQLRDQGLKDLPSIPNLPRGRLLGTAKLEDVIEYKFETQFFKDTDKHFCAEGYFKPVAYGLVLSVKEVYENPPPLKGALKFFEYNNIAEVE